jgi:hypothetical protein
MVMLLAALVLGTSLASDRAATRCDRGAPEPVGFHARGFGYVAEVFPPRSRQNASSRPLAYFYEVGYPGTEWRVDARRVWSAELVNPQRPQAALVSMEGDFVTLDDYYVSGGDHAVVIYDRGGRPIRSFTLEQLLEPTELARVPQSDCGRLWREGATFYFTRSPDARLYVVLQWGSVIELTLATGQLRRGTAADFAVVRDLVAHSFANERTEVWPINLRFASITDVVTARRP